MTAKSSGANLVNQANQANQANQMNRTSGVTDGPSSSADRANRAGATNGTGAWDARRVPSRTRYGGSRAVVIGGARGLGLAVAKLLVEGGADVLLTGRDRTGLAGVAPECGSGVYAVGCDPSDPVALAALVPTVAEHLGQIDHLFAYAGQGADSAEAAVQALLPLLREGSAVVLVAEDRAAFRPSVRTLAAELSGRDIRVNAVLTGHDGARMQRRGSADAVARAALFLAADAVFTTGAELPVDAAPNP